MRYSNYSMWKKSDLYQRGKILEESEKLIKEADLKSQDSV